MLTRAFQFGMGYNNSIGCNLATLELNKITSARLRAAFCKAKPGAETPFPARYCTLGLAYLGEAEGERINVRKNIIFDGLIPVSESTSSSYSSSHKKKCREYIESRKRIATNMETRRTFFKEKMRVFRPRLEGNIC